jgi:predicted ATPase/DNA-binding SARP family transcriptional activator
LNDGQVLKFSARPRTSPLLAYLLLQRSRPVERKSLSFILWPDESEAAARVNLRRHLYQLQHALPPAAAGLPWLLNESDTIQWNPAADFWLDIAEFERLSTSVETLAAAANLYRGDLLEDVYDDWLFYDRERLRSLYFTDLSQLIARRRTLRDYPAAIAYAQQLLKYDPLREDTLRQLLSLSYEAGDRGGALQIYKRFAQQLLEELGMDPMPETAAVYEAIIRNARLPGSDGERVQVADDSRAGGDERRSALSLPFVGREREMEQLRGWWGRAARGKGGVGLISGDEGLGKTRLAAELARQAEREGARVLLGSTTHIEPVPYQPVVEALRAALPLLAALEIEPLWLAALSSLLPELQVRRAGTADPAWPRLPALHPEGERVRLFEAVARCLLGLARPRPVLLILEDLHWAGAATIALLEYLAQRVPDHAILILVTYREEETGLAHPLRDLRRRLQRENRVTHLSLGQLPAEAIDTLVAQMPALDPANGELAHRLLLASEGHPFYLAEIVGELLDARQSENVAAPRSVQTLMRSRVAHLTSPAKALAEVAAVVGPAFDVELVRAVSGWSERQVLDAIDELLDRHMVSAARGHSRSDYTFSHHLVQAAIYGDIPAAERKHRHRRVAQALEGMYPQRLDELAAELAAHWEQGGEPEAAAEYHLRAARRALAVYADEAALGYLARALELSAVSRTRFELRAMAESIHGRRGERQAQAADLEQLAELARSFDEDELLCEVIRRQILYRRALGERQMEAGLIAELKARATASGQVRWQAEAVQAEAAHLILLSEYDGARMLLQQALALRQSLADSAGQVECYAALAEAATLQGRLGEAQAMLQGAASLAGPEASQALLVQTLRSAAVAATVQVQAETAYTLSTQLLELCRATGDRVGEADAHARLAAASARLFRVTEAREHYEQAEALYALHGDQKGQAAVLLNSAMLLANLGHYPEAIAQNGRADALFKSLGDMRGQMVSAINTALYLIQGADYPSAQTAGTRGLQLAREIKSELYEAYALSNLATAERELGKLPQAISHMEAAIALRRKFGQPVELATDLTDLTIAYLRAGDLKAARATLGELLAIFAADPEHMTYPQYILWTAAQTHHALLEPEQAQQFLLRAHAALQAKAAAIPDPESRATFQQMAVNRELLAACERGEWPPVQARSQPRPAPKKSSL